MLNYYLAFDCETTGLLTHCNVLTAYFAIFDDKLNLIDELELNIKYNFYIVYTQAMQVNKIDLIEHDKIAINQKNANKLLVEFLLQYSKFSKYKLIGHNIKFDIDMLKSNLILSKEEIEIYFDLKNIYDTYKIAKLLKTQNKINKCQSLSLSKICYYFDLSNNNADKFHTAKFDTLCTVELFKKLIELKNNSNTN